MSDQRRIVRHARNASLNGLLNMIAYPVRKQLEGRRVMRGPRAQVVLFEMHEVGDQVPSVVFVDPPQHVCCRFERSLGQESLNFASPKIGLPSKQGVLVEALPAPPTTWESRTQTRTDHVPKASLLHQMPRRLPSHNHEPQDKRRDVLQGVLPDVQAQGRMIS